MESNQNANNDDVTDLKHHRIKVNHSKQENKDLQRPAKAGDKKQQSASPDFTKYKHNEREMACKCRDFLKAASLGGNCKCLVNRKALKCNCLKVLEETIAQDTIALYMVALYRKSKVDQQLTIIDWLRYISLDEKIMFYAPFLNPCEKGACDFTDKHILPDKHAILRPRTVLQGLNQLIAHKFCA
eukprot:jgi/Psemu1/27557/gm1.27557_g